jgi:hypothetical protein
MCYLTQKYEKEIFFHTWHLARPFAVDIPVQCIAVNCAFIETGEIYVNHPESTNKE